MLDGVNNLSLNLPVTAGSNISNTISLEKVRKRKQQEKQKKLKTKLNTTRLEENEDPLLIDELLQIDEEIQTTETEVCSLGSVDPNVIDFSVKEFNKQGQNSFEEWLYQKGAALLPFETFEYLTKNLLYKNKKTRKSFKKNKANLATV